MSPLLSFSNQTTSTQPRPTMFLLSSIRGRTETALDRTTSAITSFINDETTLTSSLMETGDASFYPENSAPPFKLSPHQCGYLSQQNGREAAGINFEVS